MDDLFRLLPRSENQARSLAQYALDFVGGVFPPPDDRVLQRTELFHLDSIACGVSAIARRTNAPTVLRQEALDFAAREPHLGCYVFGSAQAVVPEKAIVANCAAVREWDSNGTNFGYNPARGATKGEFGHNDFYPVPIAAAQLAGLDGRTTLLGMVALDEIRGRLAEVFSLKDHKIDHVVHGAIASTAVFGALLGATVAQIESAIGLFVAHYIPFRAIRAGRQLSDSKGASAALSTEAAILSMRRALRGFVGPADIFRNREALFCLFEPPCQKNESPFDLALATHGGDFAVMGMHFKLGLYEHQSAGAIQGLLDLLEHHPGLLEDPGQLGAVRIKIYEPAFSIIGDPAKRDPRTRQSADHSMVYIVATLLRKAFERRETSWQALMLLPSDYDDAALFHPLTRQLMQKIDFQHGGPEYDAKYPDGIPTSLEIEHVRLGRLSSGLVMYPVGHARNTSGQEVALLEHKFQSLARLGVDEPSRLYERFARLGEKTAEQIGKLYDFDIKLGPD
ncbi:MAG TPA: MmgE/PrpD family protein [Pirellulales bacterium]|jgi:2-methylcitrate dehydratase|nr:MmgE/PrpD family protein [Pirellulales bacterium]